jgi:lysophospholipase L1-like esterase
MPSRRREVYHRRNDAAGAGGNAGFTLVTRLTALACVVIVIAVIVTSALPGALPQRLVHDIQNEQCRKAPVNARTVALGDSITRMNSDPSWHFMGTDSWFALDSCNGRIAYGYNAGVNGNTTAQMLARYPDDVAALHPTSVIVLGGTNDVLQHVAPAATISTASHAIGTTVAIGTIPPIDAGRYRAYVDPLNARIAVLAAATHSTLINFHAVVAAGDHYRAGWTTDGIHPSHVAAVAMAAAAAVVRH